MWHTSLLWSHFRNEIAKRLALQNRFISTTPVISLNRKWRAERGLAENPNTEGVLTDGPDYSYLDGRPTPFGIRQMRRILKQREIAEQVIKLTSEIDFAVARHTQLKQEEAQKRQNILSSKLKPKGIELLKKKKS